MRAKEALAIIFTAVKAAYPGEEHGNANALITRWERELDSLPDTEVDLILDEDIAEAKAKVDALLHQPDEESISPAVPDASEDEIVAKVNKAAKAKASK